MAKFLKDLIIDLAKKSGVNVDADPLKTFLATESLATLEVPSELVVPIETSLISMVDAKNNHTDIKNHYTKQALDGIDKLIDKLLDEYGLDEDAKNEVKVERNSYKKPEILIKKIQALETKKANADKPDKVAIQKQIDDLHAQLRAEKDEVTKVKSEFAQKEKNMRIQYRLDSLLNGIGKTVYDNLPAEVRTTTFRTLINQRLQDKGAMFDFNDNGEFVLLRNDKTNFFGDNNQQMNPQQFIEKLMSDNKLLVTTDSNGSANNQQTSQQSSAPAGGNGKRDNANDSSTKPKVPSKFNELMSKAQADFKEHSQPTEV